MRGEVQTIITNIWSFRFLSTGNFNCQIGKQNLNLKHKIFLNNSTWHAENKKRIQSKASDNKTLWNIPLSDLYNSFTFQSSTTATRIINILIFSLSCFFFPQLPSGHFVSIPFWNSLKRIFFFFFFYICLEHFILIPFNHFTNFSSIRIYLLPTFTW